MAEKKSGMSLDKLGIWIIGATILGAAVGLLMGKSASMFAPAGNLFMQLIKMVVVPLVLFSLIGGAASLGKSSSAGKIGGFTFIYYGITTAVAVALGLFFSELFRPGARASIWQHSLVPLYRWSTWRKAQRFRGSGIR